MTRWMFTCLRYDGHRSSGSNCNRFGWSKEDVNEASNEARVKSDLWCDLCDLGIRQTCQKTSRIQISAESGVRINPASGLPCGRMVSPTVNPAIKSATILFTLYSRIQLKIGSLRYSVFLRNVLCDQFRKHSAAPPSSWSTRPSCEEDWMLPLPAFPLIANEAWDGDRERFERLEELYEWTSCVFIVQGNFLKC